MVHNKNKKFGLEIVNAKVSESAVSEDKKRSGIKISRFKELAKNNKILLLNPSITTSLSNRSDKIIESNKKYITDVILDLESVTVYFEVSYLACIVENYNLYEEDKIIYKNIPIKNYIKIIDNNNVIINAVEIRTKEKYRKEFQETNFVCLNNSDNKYVDFIFSIDKLLLDEEILDNYDDILSTFNIYKKLINEKFNFLIPEQVKKEQQVKNDKFYELRKINLKEYEENSKMKKIILFNGIEIFEKKQDVENDMSLEEIEWKIKKINSIIRKINYRYIFDQDFINKCLKFVVNS